MEAHSNEMNHVVQIKPNYLKGPKLNLNILFWNVFYQSSAQLLPVSAAVEPSETPVKQESLKTNLLLR